MAVVAQPALSATVARVVAGSLAVAGGASVVWTETHVGSLPSVPTWSILSPATMTWIGAIVGFTLVGAGALMLASRLPPRILGLVAVAAALASVPLAWGGFVVGFLLGWTGGTLALVQRHGIWGAAVPPARGRAPPWS